jgi:hypothetical protein
MSDIEDDKTVIPTGPKSNRKFRWEGEVVTFSPANSTLIATYPITQAKRCELYEHVTGRYFARIKEPFVERIRLVSPTEALKIVTREMGPRISRLALQTVKTHFLSTLEGVRYESRKSLLLGVRSASSGTAAALYKATNGQHFMRMIDCTRSQVILIKTTDAPRIAETLTAGFISEVTSEATVRRVFGPGRFPAIRCRN